MSRNALCTSSSGLVAVACSDTVLLFDGAAPAPSVLRPEPSTGPEVGPGPQGIIQRDERQSADAQRAVIGLAFNGNCSLLAVVDGDKTVWVWSMASKECVASHRLGKKLTCVAIAPLTEGSSTEAVLVGDKVSLDKPLSEPLAKSHAAAQPPTDADSVYLAR